MNDFPSKYIAFISYSHADEKVVAWLHKSIETYPVPKRLAGQPSPLGPTPARLKPLFRDRDELASSADLSSSIKQALNDSAFLIVICSPNAVKSKWVNEEILAFQRMGKSDRVLALIVEGEPTESFPEALRTAEPIAADLRPTGDGKRNAFLKIAAGLLGVGFDELRQRDLHRRQRRLIFTSVAAVVLLSLAALLLHRAERASQALRAKAPELHALSVKLLGECELVGALEKIENAIELDKANAEFHTVRGNVLQASLRLAEAEQAYTRALELDASSKAALVNLKICRDLESEQEAAGKLTDKGVLALQFALYQQDRLAEALAMTRAARKSPSEMEALWRTVMEERGLMGDAKTWVDLDEYGMLRISLAQSDIPGIPALSGMPVRTLYLASAAEYNIAALRGLQLTHFGVKDSNLHDLSPLEGMPLNFLTISRTSVEDLGPLAHMPLEQLNMTSTPVRDLNPLKALPLNSLDLTGCVNIQDISPLAEVRSLQHLVLPPNVTNVHTLRRHPGLLGLSFRKGKASGIGVNAAESVDEFWAHYDNGDVLAPEKSDIVASHSPYDVSLSGQVNVDLSKLDRSITKLNLGDTDITDLSPLKGMKLVRLGLGITKVTDLSPLRGMPLEQLNLSGTRVHDLEPLTGMPLRLLSLIESSVEDLGPLRGLPLEELLLSKTRHVRNLEPLRGSVVRRLNLLNCTGVRDLTPLKDCMNLEDLVLPPNADVEVLRGHPSLKRLSYSSLGSSQWYPSQTVEEFWAHYDNGDVLAPEKSDIVASHSPYDVSLSGQVNVDLSKLDRSITKLNLGDTDITDLSPLKGMKLVKLALDSTKVTDLSPLRGMPLEQLNLSRTRVHDLEPLTGMPLRLLSLVESSVEDLGPLRGLPLEELQLSQTRHVRNLEPLRGSVVRRLNLLNCTGVRDLTPLKDCMNLEDLVLPPNADVEVLRGHPSLRRLSYSSLGGSYWYPSQTVEVFWAEYDRGANDRKVQAENSLTLSPAANLGSNADKSTGHISAAQESACITGAVRGISTGTAGTYLVLDGQPDDFRVVLAGGIWPELWRRYGQDHRDRVVGARIAVCGDLYWVAAGSRLKVSDPDSFSFVDGNPPKALPESSTGTSAAATDVWSTRPILQEDACVTGAVIDVSSSMSGTFLRLDGQSWNFLVVLMEGVWPELLRRYGQDLRDKVVGARVAVCGDLYRIADGPRLKVSDPDAFVFADSANAGQMKLPEFPDISGTASNSPWNNPHSVVEDSASVTGTVQPVSYRKTVKWLEAEGKTEEARDSRLKDDAQGSGSSPVEASRTEYDYTEMVALIEAAGRRVSVRGTVVEIAKSASGNTTFINLGVKERRGVDLVLFRKEYDAVAQAFGGDLETALMGKNVRITGEIKQYHDRPQIIINWPSQIEIVSNETESVSIEK